ncbi:MAG: phage integrase N-terminal SAM-like domain-containing protein [Deltaproteobacteria bacterium]|nr:phage integrase N-terminal SAM-like domain-containing protein [Deltaproteobacteria bacterium]
MIRNGTTPRAYVPCVVRFAAHFGRSPSQLGAEEVRTWQFHLRDVEHVAWSTYNGYVCALRFFYGVVLKRLDVVGDIPYAKLPLKLPVILAQSEVLAVLGDDGDERRRGGVCLRRDA